MPVQNRNVTGENQGPSKTPALDRATAKRAEVYAQLDLTAEDLGEKGKKVAQVIFERFRKQASIEDADVQKAVDELRSAHQEDSAAAYDPGAAPAFEAVSNWASSSYVKEHNGQSKLTGSASGESHPLAQLLSKLKINTNALTPKVAQTLNDAIRDKAALHDASSWTKLAQNLFLAQTQDTTQILAGLVAYPPVRIENTPTNDSKEDGGVSRNPEFAAFAPRTTGTGSAHGAFATKLQNLIGRNARLTGHKEAVQSLTKALVQDLDLGKGKNKAVSKLLYDAINADGNTNGVVSASAVANYAFSELAKIEARSGQPELGPYAMATSLMQLIDSEVGKLGDEPSPEINNLMANLAAFGLRAFIAAKFGQDSGLSSESLLAQMQSALGDLTGMGVDSENTSLTESSQSFDRAQAEADISAARTSTTESDKAPDTDKASPTEGLRANTIPKDKISSNVRAAAQNAMENLNINSLDEANASIRDAYEQIIAASKGDPVAMYLEATRWLDSRIGTNRAEHDQKMLEEGLSPGMLQTLINERFLTVAAYLNNPKEIKRKYLMNEKLAGPGANAGLRGNGLGGAGGSRFGAPQGFGTSGLLGPGSPMDADGSKNQIYAQRSLQISSILDDPGLSIEDKIFYFMMWFAAYADKERGQKMREIADLDNQSQENNMKRRELDRNRQALYQSRKGMQQVVKQAEQTLRRVSPRHEQIADTQKDIAKIKRSQNPDSAKLENLQKKLEGLQKNNSGNSAEIGKATKVLDEAKGKLMQVQVKIEGHSKQIDELQTHTDSGTKSRELLFMELERIQRFRGMLIDMANSFMRDMARRVKEIMQ